MSGGGLRGANDTIVIEVFEWKLTTKIPLESSLLRIIDSKTTYGVCGGSGFINSWIFPSK